MPNRVPRFRSARIIYFAYLKDKNPPMADLFNKIARDPVLKAARMGREMGIYPYFRPLSETEGTEVVVNGQRLIMIGSNNYLGLTTHPKVRQAAIDAITHYG